MLLKAQKIKKKSKIYQKKMSKIVLILLGVTVNIQLIGLA